MTARGNAPRGLTSEEAEAWRKLAATVEPMAGKKLAEAPKIAATPAPPVKPAPMKVPVKAAREQASAPAKPRSIAPGNLDSHWERKLKSGGIEPDFTLDLHGHGLDAAYHRLDSGLAQARAMGARIVLLIAGKSRPVEAADRAERRGAIRAKLLDWLAAGQHADAIAAIRKAHRRHGGEGALYLIIRRGA
ncbi:Smr/MutS family protein [Qipengyuania atrilutea]|uniref:Smr/MutS family protein n=1 Tax=Qipengyuania atrilutea TaxID=2744473 RepID=A0A850H3V8_9SPHN|nr:Smr/MutS family protein [Actirhodobacter atriluteus]NVD44882.1 Smr/MutS family protein [Actirhodobacter atriluteus]